jgi:uncharacterized phiE125 gp8 family phage protein
VQLTQVTPPSGSVLSLEDVRTYLRMGDGVTGSDALVDDLLIADADSWFEEMTNRRLLAQTWDITFDQDEVSEDFALPLVPLASITSVTVYDNGGTASTVSASWYSCARLGEAPRMRLSPGYSWPYMRPYGGLVVRAVAGYATAAAVPRAYIATLRCLLKFALKNQGDGVLESVAGLHDVNDLPVWLRRRVLSARVRP